MFVAPRNGKYLGLVERTKVREAGVSVRRNPEHSRGISLKMLSSKSVCRC